ncbi:MAG: hypothetical protein HY433_02235 [Candidatus Liptonbacteria bacterium]|nr:hypothetical protein [Parcubacteria group bacterium]MBI4086039.1 hypothetical protein [Candidatus Liptonbacteria bacterium]
MSTVIFLLTVIATAVLWIAGFWQWLFSFIGKVILLSAEVLGFLTVGVIALITVGVVLLSFDKIRLLREIKSSHPYWYNALAVILTITLAAVVTIILFPLF